MLVCVPDCSSLKPLRAADYRTEPLAQFRFEHLSHEALLSQILLAECVYFRRRSAAALLQTRPQRSRQSAEPPPPPPRTDSPPVRLAAASAACNGVVAAPVGPSVSPSGTITELVDNMFTTNASASVFNTSSPFGLQLILGSGAMNVSPTLLFLSRRRTSLSVRAAVNTSTGSPPQMRPMCCMFVTLETEEEEEE